MRWAVYSTMSATIVIDGPGAAAPTLRQAVRAFSGTAISVPDKLRWGWLAQATASEGGDASPWYERAYQEDSSDQSIALAYARSLMAKEQVGAAIFILEPQINAGPVSPEFREAYADALVAAGRFSEAEPMVWQLFEQSPARVQQVISLIGGFIDAEQDEEAVALAR